MVALGMIVEDIHSVHLPIKSIPKKSLNIIQNLVSSGDFGVEDKKSQKRRLLCWRDWSLRGRKLMNQQD